MLSKVTKFLKDNHLTLNQVSRASDISPSTLSNTFKRPVNSWKIGVLLKLAKMVHAPINDIIKYFSGYHWTLDINNQDQTIQGVHIKNKKTFKIIKSTITVECIEGWKPTKTDVEEVVNHYYHPLPKIDIVLNQMRNKYGKGE